MGWSIGFDSNWDRDIGYGVPATCDHPDCNEEIHRGLAYVCGDEPYGGDEGCGLFFCSKHLAYYFSGKNEEVMSPQLCERCGAKHEEPFKAKPDAISWLRWKLAHSSWRQWRKENPKIVAGMKQRVAEWRAARHASA